MPSRPTPRAAYHHGDLRAALIAAATRLVAAHGTEGFSLREAAAQVGVSPSAAYRHFADKRDLLAAVAREGFIALAEALQRAAARARSARTRRPRSVAVFEAQALAYVRFAVAHPAQFQVMFGPYGAGASQSARAIAADDPDPYRLMQVTLDELVHEGVISPAARRGAELPAWASLHGLAGILMNRALAEPERVPFERTVLHVARRTLAGLKAVVAP